LNLNIFVEFTLLFILILLVSYVMKSLRQPLIVGYILTGVVAGPFALNLVQSADALAAFAQMGIAFLLFIVGLSLNPRVIKDIGRISTITGIGQIVFTTAVGFFICKLLGFSNVTSLYISTAISFSSTIIIMKLLSDRKDLDTLYGRISIGFLIVQDLVAILILLFLSSPSRGQGPVLLAFEVVLKAFLILLCLYLLSKHFLPRFTSGIAKSQELLLLFSITWCFSIAAAFYYFGFSIEAGALFAGISLSYSSYTHEISAKVRPLRDFFIILFFIMLGSQLVFSDVKAHMLSIAVLSAFILVGNPVIVMALMGALGYKKRTGFMAGLTVAQISEFSLVLIALGVSLGQLSGATLSIVTTIGLITIAGSSYMIIYADRIYNMIARHLAFFERRTINELAASEAKSYDVMLFGYNRMGFDVFMSLKKLKKSILVIDYDPGVIAALEKQGHACAYGDAGDYEFLEELNLAHAEMIISTFPDKETNSLLIRKALEKNPKIIISLVSLKLDDAIELYEQGATYIIMPQFIGGRHLSMLLEKNKLSLKAFSREKAGHVKYLLKRRIAGDYGPRKYRRR
jgi:Kef-type K+ transport system membrane component KefB/voltage-gated potassium channel Kch